MQWARLDQPRVYENFHFQIVLPHMPILVSLTLMMSEANVANCESTTLLT